MLRLLNQLKEDPELVVPDSKKKKDTKKSAKSGQTVSHSSIALIFSFKAINFVLRSLTNFSEWSYATSPNAKCVRRRPK